MSDLLLSALAWAVGLVIPVVALLSAAHAVLYKRDTRAVIGWVGLIWLAPVVGPLLYAAFGVNRIRRRARTLRGSVRGPQVRALPGRVSPPHVARHTGRPALAALAHLMDRVVEYPLTAGNRVTLLDGGDEAFPAMRRAIGQARHTIALATYIFDDDRAGRVLFGALREAVERGVAVRVLVDAVGARYSRPPMTHTLRRAGVPCAAFLPTRVPWRFPYLNLRNHRKLMLVDGRLAFTGGMNIREASWPALRPRHAIRDLHARVSGPVAAQLMSTFAADWAFTTGEVLAGERWFPRLTDDGGVLARAIPDGPDEDFEEFRHTVLGALTVARESVGIVTPYFLPDDSIITALNIAALRGVAVDIVLPARSNLRLVQWAGMAMLWQVLERGCRVWLTPPPFDHSKLMVVDATWCLLGSANWDARSLRLNFELNVECYDAALAAQVLAAVRQRIDAARPLTLADVDGRALPVRLRDGVARLLTPYL